MDERPSRRSVLATAGTLALAGLAGCTSGDDESKPKPSDGTTKSTDEPSATTTDAASTTESEPSVDWTDVAAFRTWLTDYSTLPESNHRFDYQSVALDRVLESGRVGFLDLAPETVDGFLTQSTNVFFPGTYDAAALVDAVEASDDHEVSGEYEGYTTAERTETGTQVAVGDDAVLAGSELSVWIDAHVGERDRLEQADPLFTRLFERLPDSGLVTAQYGPPAGGNIDSDAIDAWATSMASLEAESGTWVYALEPGTGTDTVDDLESQLAASAFTDEVTDRAVDDRFVTFTATVALPE